MTGNFIFKFVSGVVQPLPDDMLRCRIAAVVPCMAVIFKAKCMKCRTVPHPVTGFALMPSTQKLAFLGKNDFEYLVLFAVLLSGRLKPNTLNAEEEGETKLHNGLLFEARSEKKLIISKIF